MKKITFFVLLVCFSSALYAQSSKSIGLTTSYLFHDKDVDWITETPQVGLAYNYFFNKKHGIVTELGVHILKREWVTLSMSPAFVSVKEYNLNYSLHYLFKHKHFFVKSGFNAQIFNAINVSGGEKNIPEYLKESEESIFFYEKSVSVSLEQMQVIPEFHFELGRDFDLGKINIRVSGFMEKPFLYNDYPFLYTPSIDFGLSAGVFYQFGK